MASAPFISTIVELADQNITNLEGHYYDGTATPEKKADTPSNSIHPASLPRDDSTAPASTTTLPAPEFILPDMASLLVMILGNCIAQVSFFIIVSSASAYAEHLGGTATFSGLTIGIPTLFAGAALIPMVKTDQGQYRRALQISYISMFIGNILYALAYRAHYLYLILIGRIITGFGFTSFMYSKRYCSDPRIVGVRRRTTLASWLVVGQGFGFSAGPFIGGLLYRVGFSNDIFNGFTSPGWIMAVCWAVFGTIGLSVFVDVPPARPRSPAPDAGIQLANLGRSSPSEIDDSEEGHSRVTYRQWGVIMTMMWYAMTCFFILGAWESNIPVYSAVIFGYTPYNAGNFIALGGVTAFPFLILNVWYSRRVQDRVILALGSSLGLAGILIMLATIHTNTVHFGSFYVCWFLIALGFNLASTCTLSLLSKQLPPSWNGRISLAIQYSNYTGRVTGAIWGGAGVKVGMMNYLGLQIAIVGVGVMMHLTLWKELKAKTG